MIEHITSQKFSNLQKLCFLSFLLRWFDKSGKDPEGKFKASNKWLFNFTRRKGISKQRKTNKKSKSIEERLPQVLNFHWWTVYEMATQDP